MGAAEVETFLSYLASERKVSASTLNQAKAALLFLYKVARRSRRSWKHCAARLGSSPAFATVPAGA